MDNIDVSALRGEFTFTRQREAFDATTDLELRYEKDRDNNLTRVYADVNGDNTTDMHIRLADVLTLCSTDFIP